MCVLSQSKESIKYGMNSRYQGRICLLGIYFSNHSTQMLKTVVLNIEGGNLLTMAESERK